MFEGFLGLEGGGGNFITQLYACTESNLTTEATFFPTVPSFAVRETASLGIMGEPRVPPLNPSETIVF